MQRNLSILIFTERKLEHKDAKEMLQALGAVSGRSRILNQATELQDSCPQSLCCRNVNFLEHSIPIGHVSST